MSTRRRRRGGDPPKKGLSGGAWAAIIISIVVVIVVVIVLVWFFLLRDTSCATDADCPAGTPNCDASTGVCHVCINDDDCPPGRACNASRTQCFIPPCETDDDCPSGLPRCQTESGICVECLSSGPPDCAAGEQCINTICTPPTACISDANCTDEDFPFCDTESGTCVECLEPEDCPGFPTDTCNDGTCVLDLSCTVNNDCPQEHICTDNFCTQIPCPNGNIDCPAGAVCAVSEICVPNSCATDDDCAGDDECQGSNCACGTPDITSGVAGDGWPNNTAIQFLGNYAKELTVVSYTWQVLGEDIGGDEIMNIGDHLDNVLVHVSGNNFEIDWDATGQDTCVNLEDNHVFGCHSFAPGSGCNFGDDLYTVRIRFNNLIFENGCGEQSSPYCVEVGGVCPPPQVGAPPGADDGSPYVSITGAGEGCFAV